MTFDVTGLLIFLLAIVPGFVAQQSRYSIIPRSLQEKSLVEETGDYVLNSVFIHLIVLSCFQFICGSVTLPLCDRKSRRRAEKAAGMVLAASLPGFYLLLHQSRCGLFSWTFPRRAVRNQPFRNWIAGFKPFRWLLTKAGIIGFLQDEPVWYGCCDKEPKTKSLSSKSE